VEFVATLPDAEAVSLVGSCARRSDANDLDLTVLVPDAAAVERVEEAFATFAAMSDPVAELAMLGPRSGSGAIASTTCGAGGCRSTTTSCGPLGSRTLACTW
jgi:hypothetical protein